MTGRDPGADGARFQRYGAELARAMDGAVATWIEATVARVARNQLGSVPDELVEAARVAAEAARLEVGAAMDVLLSTDVDEQRSTPLAIVRRAGAHATRVLREAGVAPISRDAFSEERFPDDVYGIGPGRLVELSPSCHDAGMAWGAAKAYVHRSRHRDDR